MSAPPTILQGNYFDGVRPIGSPGTLTVAGERVTLHAGSSSEDHNASGLLVSPRIGRSERFVALPGGGQFQCPDDALLDTLPQEVSSEGPIAWLEQHWPVAIACIVLIAGLLTGGYLYGLPLAADRVAARVPIESEQALGEESLNFLERVRLLTPTGLDEAAQQRLHQQFAALTRGMRFEHQYRLELRSGRLGANAMALPGGIVVLTDELVALSASEDEVLAVIAHEIGHVELRHALRQLLGNSAVAVTLATMTGDAASLGTAVTGLPVTLAQLQYSREFERAADDYALELMRSHGLSPLAFASMLERLAARHGTETEGPAFLSTHPVTAERIARIRAAAQSGTR
jgi:Zn-dependent protease with chaperone function